MTRKQHMVDYGSNNMQSLRNARTATEMRKLIGGITSGIASLSSSADFTRSVSANSIELSDLDGTPRNVGTKRLQLDTEIDISKLDLTDANSKAKYNKKVAHLNQAIAELGVAYQILSSRTFSSFKNQADAAKQLRAVIEEANEIQTKLIRIMSADVKKGAPKEHTKLAATVSNYISTMLSRESYTSLSSRTFIARGTNPIVYQTFIYVKDFTNHDGVKYPNYSVVLSTEIDLDTQMSRNFITTLVDSKVPGTFPLGAHADSLANLKKSINTYMSMDGFLNHMARKPLSKDTTKVRDTTGLGNRTHNIRGKDVEIIDGVRVQNDKLYVRLVRGMSPRERQSAVEEVLAMASTIFRTGSASRTALMHRIVKGRQGREWVEVSLTSSAGQAKGQLTLDKIKKFAKEFDLDESQIRNLKQGIK